MLRRLALLTLLAASARADEAIDWTEAASCVGRFCTIRGTVVAMEEHGPTYRLFFDATRRDVYVTLMRGWLVNWPDFVGHPIAATGAVDQFQDATEMIVRAQDAVRQLDAPTTPSADASSTEAPRPTVPTAAPTGELGQLREDMRRLQEKIEQLESDAPKEAR